MSRCPVQVSSKADGRACSHHLARHSVACFLTRGHLYISWERGQEVFDDWLIDWDPSVNSGNWMWLSVSLRLTVRKRRLTSKGQSTAYFSQYFRVYSPISYGKKWDKHGDYIRKFVPELKDFPDKFIYSVKSRPPYSWIRRRNLMPVPRSPGKRLKLLKRKRNASSARTIPCPSWTRRKPRRGHSTR